MKSESDVKRQIVKDFLTTGNYGRRIEDAYSVGFPDLVLGLRDMPIFFTEAKLVSGFTFGPSPRQYVELTRLAILRYSFPTLLGYKEGVHYLTPYAERADIRNCVNQQPGEHITETFRRYYNERR